jgi:dTDP-4-amino-4,6-dideoxygalactose transaminase
VGRRLLDALGRESQPSTHPEAKTDIEYAPPFSTMSDFQGGVGLSVFRKLADQRRQRAATAQFYSEQFDGLGQLEQLTPVEGLGNHQFVRYPVLVASTELRDTLVSQLRHRGIGASGLYDWPPIDDDQYPGAATLQNRMLALPTHPYVTDRDRRRVVETVQRAIASESQAV